MSLDAIQGQLLVLLGHNGAGKTTLVSMISGLLEVTQGEIQFKGESLTYNKELLQ